MAVLLKTQNFLWGKAAGRCSMASCRQDVFHHEDEAPAPTLVGENCHIIAEKDNGPRGDPNFPVEQRNEYANLILLCRNHHKIIDDKTNGVKDYSVQRLQSMKMEHEEWVRKNLDFDHEKQRDEVIWASIVDEWERLCHLADWETWSSSMLSSGQPSMSTAISMDLKETRSWILKRVWPKRYTSLRQSFENFREVLEALQNLFLEHGNEKNGTIWTNKFYKIREWDEPRYFGLLRDYEYHVDLVQDLMLELTRAANRICDEIRDNLEFSYRRAEGKLSIYTGPNERLQFTQVVVEYTADDAAVAYPFGGLENFKVMRRNRDMAFGSEKIQN